MNRFVVLLMLSCLAFCSATGTQVNIHLKLDSTGEQLMLNVNEYISTHAPNNQINFFQKHQPHFTLYLTTFVNSSLPTLMKRLGSISSSFPPCSINMAKAVVIGEYGMWNSVTPACLQHMSDAVVNGTFDLAVPNQEVPSWVYDLPSPQRELKIAYIQKYGSPNVFSQFEPHVTLAWDNVKSDNLTEVFRAMKLPAFAFESPVLGAGQVGDYGTVLRGQDFDDWMLVPYRMGWKH